MQSQQRQPWNGNNGSAASTPPAAPEPSAWGVYFPSSTYNASDRRAQLIQEILAALSTEAGWQLLSNGLKAMQHLTSCVVALDYEQLLQLRDSPNLSAALEMQPAEGLACLQAAVHEVRAVLLWFEEALKGNPLHLPWAGTVSGSPSMCPPLCLVKRSPVVCAAAAWVHRRPCMWCTRRAQQ